MRYTELIENNDDDMFGSSERVHTNIRRATFAQNIPEMIRYVQQGLLNAADKGAREIAVEFFREANFMDKQELRLLARDLYTHDAPQHLRQAFAILSEDPAIIEDVDRVADTLMTNNIFTDIRNDSDLWIYATDMIADFAPEDSDLEYHLAMEIEGTMGNLIVQLIQAAYNDVNALGEDIEINEKWSAKYKKSINCANPRGFSQRAHCAGRKKHNEDLDSDEDLFSNRPNGKVIAHDLELWLRRRQTGSRRPLSDHSANAIKEIIAAFNQSLLAGVEAWQQAPIIGDLKWDIRSYIGDSQHIDLADLVTPEMDGINEAPQEISELYDAQTSFPIEWNDSFGPEEMSGRAYDRQGNYIDIKFIPLKNGIVEVEFSRNDSYDMTGGGDANRVLGTVLEAFREYLRGYQPKIFIFSAKGGSRSKVYQSLIKRFAAGAGYRQFDMAKLSPATREKLGASGTDVMVLRKMVSPELAEAPLADYQPMGDFNKPGPFRGADKRLVPHPVNQLKTAKFFEQTPYDFRLFFSNIPGTGRYSEYGPMRSEVVQEIFKDQAAQILQGHEDAITVVFVGNKGDSKVMLTPWMMAHRIGHAVQAGTRTAGGQGAWREAENHFFRGINQLLKDFYGKSSNNRYDSDANWAMSREYAALFNAIGTQRSSRTGQIKRPYEFLYELFAQYLGTGEIKLNPLPKSKEYGRKVFGRSSQSLRMQPGSEEESRYTTEVLARDMEIMFSDVLSELVGKVLVM